MKKQILWGLLFIIFGGLLIVGKLGYLGEINAFSLVLTIFFAVVIIKSLYHLEFGGVLFPLAFIGIIYDEQLHITAITPWTILLAALLGTIGLSLIFGRVRVSHKHKIEEKEYDFEIIDSEDSECIRIHNSFGATAKYINTEELEQVEIDSSFSGTKVYFDHAKIKNGKALVKIQASFSGVELYIPKEWKIVNQLSCSLGGVTEKNYNTGTSEDTLVLTGNVSFAGVDIFYV